MPPRIRKFLRCFYDEYQPATPTEITLVDTIAVARWRLMRMSGFEATVVDHEYQTGNFDAGAQPLAASDAAADAKPLPVPIRTGLSYRRAADSGRSLETMSRSEGRLQHQFNGALDRLIRLRALSKREEETK